MASRFIDGALPHGRNTLDVPVAALAGLSVAFLAFAAPADALGRLIEASRLASLLPAAEPPFGANARIAIGAAGALLVFAIAFLLLRWLDRFGGRSRRSAREADMETEAGTAPPRLRRRDFHPDAPARRPLLAGHELGEPEAAFAPAPEAVPAATPPWLAPADEIACEPEAAEEPEPLELIAEVEAEPGPDLEPEPRQGQSIAELLERLEAGLARRRTVPAAAPAPAVAPAAIAAPPPPAPSLQPAPQVFPEPADDRLQSAIESLQRLAARND